MGHVFVSSAFGRGSPGLPFSYWTSRNICTNNESTSLGFVFYELCMVPIATKRWHFKSTAPAATKYSREVLPLDYGSPYKGKWLYLVSFNLYLAFRSASSENIASILLTGQARLHFLIYHQMPLTLPPSNPRCRGDWKSTCSSLASNLFWDTWWVLICLPAHCRC